MTHEDAMQIVSAIRSVGLSLTCSGFTVSGAIFLLSLSLGGRR